MINKDDDRCKPEQLFHDQQLSISHTELLRPLQADMNGWVNMRLMEVSLDFGVFRVRSPLSAHVAAVVHANSHLHILRYVVLSAHVAPAWPALQQKCRLVQVHQYISIRLLSARVRMITYATIPLTIEEVAACPWDTLSPCGLYLHTRRNRHRTVPPCSVREGSDEQYNKPPI